MSIMKKYLVGGLLLATTGVLGGCYYGPAYGPRYAYAAPAYAYRPYYRPPAYGYAPYYGYRRW